MMGSRLIRLADDIMIEVDSVEGDTPKMGNGMAIRKVRSRLDDAVKVIAGACSGLDQLWDEAGWKSTLEEAEVELGIGYESEGNVYITKTLAEANLRVRIRLRPAAKKP